jgi:hypothetical protein
MLKVKLNRDTTYATIDAMNSVSSTAGTVT